MLQIQEDESEKHSLWKRVEKATQQESVFLNSLYVYVIRS